MLRCLQTLKLLNLILRSRIQTWHTKSKWVRYNTSTTQIPIGKFDKPPQMMIAFTCKKCDTRSSHTFSKQAYDSGLVLIQCPGCKNRHLIADKLKVFRDENFNIQSHLQSIGQSVTTDPISVTPDDMQLLGRAVGERSQGKH